MLTLEPPFYELDGIVVFRDHAAPTLFHYLAGPPRLTVRDGVPSFLLLRYRAALAGSSLGPQAQEQLGGGFLTFSVDCGVDEATLASVRRQLTALVPPGTEGEISLVPVLYTRGTVKLLAVEAVDPAAPADEREGRFVRGVLGTATPSLLGGQVASFSLALSPLGVALVEGAYRAALSPIGVLYELELSGLRPALSVRVRTDQRRVYERLRQRFGVDASLGGSSDQPAGQRAAALDVDVEAETRSLVQSGAIEIEVTQEQVGAAVDEQREAAMQLVKEQILARFFSPTMSAVPAGSLEAAARGMTASTTSMSHGRAADPDTRAVHRVQLGFQLRHEQLEQLETVTFDYDVARPEPRIHAPNGFFSALALGTRLDDHIREIELDDPFFRTIDVEIQTTADFTRLALQTLAVEIQYGGDVDAPGQTATMVFSAADHAPKHFQCFRDRDDFSYRYRVHYELADDDEVAAPTLRLTTAWRSTVERVLVVHPPSDIELLHVYVEPALVEWDLVARIEVLLSYDDPGSGFHAERTFLVERGSPRQEWLVRLPPGASRSYLVRHTWHLANGSVVRGAAEPHDHPRLFVMGPFTGRLRIRVVPAVDAASVSLVLGELVHVDPGTGLELRRSLSLKAPFQPVMVELPMIDAAHDEYTWSYELVPATGGEGRRTGPIVTRARVLVVSDQGVAHHPVEVVLRGDMTAAGVLAVQVDLRGDPPPGHQPRILSHLFEPDAQRRTTLRLALRADREPVFEYQTTVVTLRGEPVVRTWQEHAGPVLALDVATLLAPAEP